MGTEQCKHTQTNRTCGCHIDSVILPQIATTVVQLTLHGISSNQSCLEMFDIQEPVISSTVSAVVYGMCVPINIVLTLKGSSVLF